MLPQVAERKVSEVLPRLRRNLHMDFVMGLTLTLHGSAAQTKIPMACYEDTFRRGWTLELSLKKHLQKL
jgi:hypothetical protein